MSEINENKVEFDFLLKQLFGYYENDLSVSDNKFIDVKKHRDATNSMILAVSKLVNDIRYCSKSECSCSPESQIKRIYENHGDILRNSRNALYPIPFKTIEKIIEEK